MPATSWKLPPSAKVYEALSAVADDRVQIVGPLQAVVQSSDRAKTYTVVWNEERSSFGSNDNASYWVGYMGYPIIATLLTLEMIEFDKTLASALQGINWNELNQSYKRRYDDAVAHVLAQIEKNGGPNARKLTEDADRIFDQLKSLKLGRINAPGSPPKRT